MITKEHITVGLREETATLLRPAINPDAEIHLFGQEVNPETWAVSKSDLFMKDPTGRDADNIAFGSTLSNDRHAGKAFDYLIANPPYGKDWKRDEDAVRAEHERGAAGRFGPGLPRISDGQLLFLLHMLAHAKDPKDGGSRIAIIMNGSPLFTGDAGSGESEIRRFILENDLLEALIALPEQLFYNTGIATYMWVVTNRKGRQRAGKVQLIDATAFWMQMRKSLGDKRREIPLDRAQDIVKILREFRDGDTRTCHEGRQGRGSRRQPDFPDHSFRLSQDHRRAAASTEFSGEPGAHRAPRRARRAFRRLPSRRRRELPVPRSRPKAVLSRTRSATSLRTLPQTLFKDREEFEHVLELEPRRRAGLEALRPRSEKAILSALSERDETARSAATRMVTLSPIRSCATPRVCRFLRVVILSTPEYPSKCERLLRARGQAARARRLDRRRQARLEGRQSRCRRL